MLRVIVALLVLLAGDASAVDFPRQGFPEESGVAAAREAVIVQPPPDPGDPVVIDLFTSNAAVPCEAPCGHGLFWSVRDATDCTSSQDVGTGFNVDGPWAGDQFNGVALANANSSTTYTLSCTGLGDSDSAEVTVVTVPRSPTNLACNGFDERVRCIWSHPFPQTVDQFDFGYRCPSGSGGYTPVLDVSSPHGTTPLTNGTECDFRVRALGPETSASLDVNDTATPADTIAPGIPNNFQCFTGVVSQQVTCQWTASSGDVATYSFAICLNSTGCDDESEWAIEASSTSPEVRGTLTNGALYRARVRATDEAPGLNSSTYATTTFTPSAIVAPAIGTQTEGNQTNANELSRFVALIGGGIYASRAAVLDATAESAETAWAHTITAGAWEDDTSSGQCEPAGSDGPDAVLQEAAADVWAMALDASITSDTAMKAQVRARLLEFAATTTFDREDSGTLLSAGNQCILDLSIAVHHLIEAALRLSGDGYATWTVVDRDLFETWLVDEVFTFTDWAAVTRKNNWGSLGLSAAAAIANYTDGSGRTLTRADTSTITPANYMAAIPAMAVTFWQSTAGNEMDSACAAAAQPFGFRPQGSWADGMRMVNDTTADCNAATMISITAAGASPDYPNKHASGLVRLAELLRRDGSSTIFNRDQDSDTIPDLLESIRFNAGTPASDVPIGGSPTFTARTAMLSYLFVAGEFFDAIDVVLWADTNGSTRGGRDYSYGSITHAPGVAYLPGTTSPLTATFTGPCEFLDTNGDADDDCYCTRVSGNGADGLGDALYDSALLGCHDYDHPDHLNVADIVSNRGTAGARGYGSRVNEYWGSPSGDCAYDNGTPAVAQCTGVDTPYGSCAVPQIGPVPAAGATCGVSGCGPPHYMPNDEADGNSQACHHFQAPGMVNDEIAGNALSGGNVSGGEVFSGNAHLYMRIPPQGRAGESAFGGSKFIKWNRIENSGGAFNSAGSTLGVTLARAYPSNLQTAHPQRWDAAQGFNNANWKGDQWGVPFGDQFPEGTVGCANAPFDCAYNNDNLPFAGGPRIGSSPDAALAAMTTLAGTAVRQVGAIRIAPAWPASFTSSGGGGCVGRANCNDSETFLFKDDWGLGEWGCVRWYINGVGVNAPTGEMWMEFQGPNDPAPRRLIHFTNVNMAQLLGTTVIGQLIWDNNYNPGIHPTEKFQIVESLGRYEDNFHARNGVPVTCGQIGFPTP